MNARNLAEVTVDIGEEGTESVRPPPTYSQHRRTTGTVMRTSRFWIALTAVLLANSSGVLAHWPDQPPHQIADLGDLQLESGGVIHNLKMSYVTHGELNAAKDNAILFMHGWGLNHHQMDHRRVTRSASTS